MIASSAAVLSRLRVFPFKSLDGIDLERSAFAPSGALAFDREFALVDANEKFITAKRDARVHRLRATYDVELGTATMTSELNGDSVSFAFDDSRQMLEAFLSEHFGRAIAVVRDREGGFPDDTQAHGPTIVSTATLHEVASWFPGLGVDSVRERLRANLEIAGVPAFWEDRLFGPDQNVSFAVGAARFEGVNPCARCVVPSRDARTGEVLAGFAKIVAARRAATLPAWAARERFDHFYRLTVNTRGLATRGVELGLGDRVEETRPAA